jgi:hypothetical protein
MPTPEQDAWQGLIDSPGWALLQREAARRWGNATTISRLREELAKINTGASSVQDWTALARALAAQDAVHELLAMPVHALNATERKEEAEPKPLIGRRA